MDGIGGVNPSETQAAQAIQAAQANLPSGSAQTQTLPPGLPPINLANAAAANTVNAYLVASQWGIDPAAAGGVYGGASASGGLFSGEMLLPLLANLTHANAEQALALIGVKTPTPGTSASAVFTGGTGSVPTPSQTAEAATAPSGPMVVDPLWGRSA